ncbi:fimbrial protein [Aeromonas bivalvium]|uniref:fimbrial protein n=1 Tax=Aeromonas bivalvium TaxID=440079 RepID=UPI000DCF7DCA|nr:fimbrial protein [Aeromonas bivalvium]
MPLIILLLIWGVASPLWANSIMIPIRGYIGENGCSVSAGSSNIVVNLGAVTVSQMSSHGQSDLMPFDIWLEECGLAATTVKVKFSGTADSHSPSLFKVDEGGAQGVALEILSHDLATMEPDIYGGSLALVATPSGGVNLRFYARYKKISTVIEPGIATALSTFTLEYQ